MRTRLRRWAFASLLAGVPVAPARAGEGAAPDEVRQFVVQVADDIATNLKAKGVGSVNPKVLGFKGFGGSETGVLQGLTEELKSRGIDVSGRARHDLVVRSKISDDEAKQQRFQIRFVASVNEGADEVYRVLHQGPVADPQTLAEFIGRPVEFRSRKDATPELGREDLFKAIQSRTVYVSEDQRQVLSGTAAKFGLGVAEVGAQLQIGQGLKVSESKDAESEGLAFTTLRRGANYGLLVYNYTRSEVAIDVKADGVNVFHFADGKPGNKWYILPAATDRGPGTGVVPGWFKNMRQSQAFALVPFAESAVAKAGLPTADVGLFTVSFHSCWDAQRGPPADEPQVVKVSTKTVPVQKTIKRADGSLHTVTVTNTVYETAIGFGVDVTTDSKGVARTVGKSRGVVSLRYER